MKITKRKAITMGIILSGTALFYYLQTGRVMEAQGNYCIQTGSYHEEYLIVVANKLYVADQDKCAREILTQCRENRLKNIRFSYDSSVPDKLQVTVYLSRWHMEQEKPEFQFSCTCLFSEQNILSVEP